MSINAIPQHLEDLVQLTASISSFDERSRHETITNNETCELLCLYEQRAELFLRLNQSEEALSDCMRVRELIQSSNGEIDTFARVKIFALGAAAARRLGFLCLAAELLDILDCLDPHHVDIKALQSIIHSSDAPVPVPSACSTYAWGSNANGELGLARSDGRNRDRSVPTAIDAFKGAWLVDASCGVMHNVMSIMLSLLYS